MEKDSSIKSLGKMGFGEEEPFSKGFLPQQKTIIQIITRVFSQKKI